MLGEVAEAVAFCFEPPGRMEAGRIIERAFAGRRSPWLETGNAGWNSGIPLVRTGYTKS
jgi:hypothetical protein